MGTEISKSTWKKIKRPTSTKTAKNDANRHHLSMLKA